MQIQTRLIKKKDGVISRPAFARISRKCDVEGEEPFQTPAALVKVYLNIVNRVRVSNESVEVLRIRTEPYLQLPILPEPPQLARHHCPCPVGELVAGFVITG